MLSVLQVFELLKKLYKEEYGCDPVSPKVLDTAAPDASSAPSKNAAEAAKAMLDNKSDSSSNIEDDSDFNATMNKNKKQDNIAKQDYEDDWDMDDDFGETEANKATKSKYAIPENSKIDIDKNKAGDNDRRTDFLQ